MPQSIIRSRSMITRTLSRTAWEQIDDGSILQQDRVIETVGIFEALRAANPTVQHIQNALPGTLGEVIYQNGHFTRDDRTAALEPLHQDLAMALATDEIERRNLSKALLPHVRKFYANDTDPARHEPFYRVNSRS